MDKQEQIEILKALRCGQRAFLDALNGITEDLAAKRPRPERWSVLECVGHVALSEDFLRSLVMHAEHVSVPVINKVREDGILVRGADRTRPMVSPEAVRPTGRFPSLSDALQYFLVSRSETIRYLENCSEDLRSMLATHPLLGSVNCREIVLLMAVHPHRHAKQIHEVRDAFNDSEAVQSR